MNKIIIEKIGRKWVSTIYTGKNKKGFFIRDTREKAEEAASDYLEAISANR